MASEKASSKRSHSEISPSLLDMIDSELNAPFDQCDELFGPNCDDTSDDEDFDDLDDDYTQEGSGTSIHPNINNASCQSHTNTKSVYADIDAQVHQLCSPWKGVIELPLIPIPTYQSELPTADPTIIDICKFLGGQQPNYWRLAFSPTDFPAPTPVEAAIIQLGSKADSKFQSVKNAIISASYDGNSPVSLNPSKNKTFKCRFSLNGSGNNHKALDKDYCDEKIGGYLPPRRGGKLLPRRSARIITVQCKFQFTVKWEMSKYYFIELRNNSGCPTHSLHPQIIDRDIPRPPRLMPENIQADAAHIQKMSSGGSLARTYLYGRLGQHYDRRALQRLFDNSNNSESNVNAIEQMIADLDQNPFVSYHALWDKGAHDVADILNPGDNEISTNRLVGITKLKKTHINRESYHQDFTHDTSMQGMVEYVNNERSARSLHPHQNVFIALAWISVQEIRYFKLFPEVAWCDVTSHSNKSKFCLLTFSCRTSTRKVLTFSHMWLPNER